MNISACSPDHLSKAASPSGWGILGMLVSTILRFMRILFPSSFRYTLAMQQVTLQLPDELSAYLTASGQNLSRAALEAIALEAYRERKVSAGQLRRPLGYRTRMQVHALLKDHGVYLHYDLADLEHDRQAGDSLPLQTA
jgi:predicted HTH domain antitoxin